MTHEIVEYLLSGVGLTSISGGLIWAVKQQGRINGHDALFAEREKQGLERHTDLKERLERIETGQLDIVQSIRDLRGPSL